MIKITKMFMALCICISLLGTNGNASVLNGSFESPFIRGVDPEPVDDKEGGAIAYFLEDDVPGWFTDQKDDEIVLWEDGIERGGDFYYAYDGNQFAEVSEKDDTTLNQVMTGFDIGDTFSLEFAHMSEVDNSGIINIELLDLGIDGIIGGLGLNADTVLFDQNYNSVGVANWTFYDEDIVSPATGNDIFLNITSISNKKWWNFVDAVAFSATGGNIPLALDFSGTGTAPEPSSLMLMLLGAFLLKTKIYKKICKISRLN